jgi:hypothetical protein
MPARPALALPTPWAHTAAMRHPCFPPRRPGRWLARLLPFALCLLPSLLPAADAPKFELRDGDRVLFIGDTFFEREVDYGHLETRLTAAFPDRHVTFRNLGWAADTPLGRSRASFDWNKPEEEWLKRVKEQIALVKPTVAFLSYGMTAALELAETPAAEQPAKLEKFKADLGKLMDAIEEVSGQEVRFVLVGPSGWYHYHFKQGSPETLVRPLNKTENFLKEIAHGRRCVFVKVNGIIPRTRNPGESPTVITENGIHATEDHYSEIVFLLWQDLVSVRQKDYWSKPAEEILRAAIRRKNDLFFHRWRPARRGMGPPHREAPRPEEPGSRRGCRSEGTCGTPRPSRPELQAAAAAHLRRA